MTNSPDLPRDGNGATIAATDTATISTITTMFDTDIWKKCQCAYDA